MKKLIIAAVIIVFSLSASADANTNYVKRVGGYFYTSLSPYGTWIDIGFGSPVWRPTIMRRNWSPYYQGQWVYTNYGWYWDSYEPFGAIVYHYGRWYNDDYYGWIWIPDDEWAPSWVEWRYDDDYVGWAPLSPYSNFSISIGIYNNYDYYVPYTYWNFVDYNHFCHNNVYNYYVAPKYKNEIYGRSKYRTNYSYSDGRVRNDGVEFDRIRERSGRNIEKRNIVTVDDPRELTRNRSGNNRDKEIRTYIAKREDISRDNLRDVKIERSERKSTLDFTRVDLGRDRNLDRTKNNNDDLKRNGNIDVQKNGRDDNQNINKRNNNDNVLKDNQKDVMRERTNDERKTQERSDIQKRNTELEKRNNDQIKRNEEIKRNEQIKKNEQVELQRKANEEMNKRNEVIYQNREQKKSNTEVFRQNNDRKNEQIQQNKRYEVKNQNSNTNVQRNTEVKRNNNNVRNENRDSKKTEDNNTKTRNR